MSVPITDLIWQQGEDGEISLTYKNPDPVNLTGWSLRMDIGHPTVGQPTLYTFNSDDANAGTEDEATLGTTGNITIVVPRTTTLAGGALVNFLNQPLKFDVFLRSPASALFPNGKQTKILKGTVTIEDSVTLWAT